MSSPDKTPPREAGRWTMSPAKPPARLKKLGYAALIGVVLGLVCQSLPPDYRTLCTAVARIVSTACGLP